MGNDVSTGTYQELEGMSKYAGFSPGQVDMIREKFDLMADEDLTLTKESFEKLMKVKPQEADKIFEFFDIDQSNRIDSYEFICGLALLSQTNLKGKAELIFNLYDFDKNRTITQNELVILIKTTMTSLNAMAQKPEASIQEAEQKCKDILQQYDTNKDGTISLKEFQSFISKDPDILRMLHSYGLISQEDLRPDFGNSSTMGDGMPECDTDLENEIRKGDEERDERVERITNGIEHNEVYQDEEEKSNLQGQSQEKKEEPQAPWQKTVSKLKFQEVDQKLPKGQSNPPAAGLDIDFVHGFRCFDTRNNIKYSPTGEIIYHTAALGIVLDASQNNYTQTYFQEHNDDIVCMDVHENKVVTGQLGLNPMLCVWKFEAQRDEIPARVTTEIVYKGVLKNGIGNVCFSNDGKRIAACALDEDHTIAIYDVHVSQANRLNPLQSKKQQNQQISEDGLFFTGKVSKAPVFDVRFDPSDKLIIVGCLKEIIFYQLEQNTARKLKGIWEKSVPLQSVLCIGFVEAYCVTGMFKGSLSVWNKNRLHSNHQAHNGPVTAMVTRKGATKGLITGGRDGFIMIWDHNIKNIQKIDTREFRFLTNRIVAIAESSQQGKIVVGTRSSEIAEIGIGEQSGKSHRTVIRGHFDGELWGLAIHQKNNQFFTVGEDNLLACWDLKKKSQLLGVKLDFPAKALNMSLNGKFLAVGCTNGSVLIVDPKSLVVTFTFKDRDKEVSCIKFSPDNEYLAVAYDQPSCEILIYSVKHHFKNEIKLRGSTQRVTHMDFSVDSKLLMCNNAKFELLFFDLSTQKLAAQNKLDTIAQEPWSTWTCIFGWQVQGIWPPCSLGMDINSVDRSKEVIVTADDFSKIKLFKYPCSKPNSSFNKFSGHSAQITNVRFSHDSQYIISTGGNEKSIIVWKYNYDQAGQQDLDDIIQKFSEDPFEQQDDEEEKQEISTSNKPYHGEINKIPPLQKENKVPTSNLSLSYAFGFRSFYGRDVCRGMCKYLSNGKIVFGTAALGVVQETKGKQTTQSFFQKHKEDVVSMCIHPKCNLVATGQMALGGNSKVIDIFIWDAETKSVLGHINDFHRKAVIALEFSPNGQMLFTAGQDEDNSIAIYDWQSARIIATSKVDRARLYGIAWRDDSTFVTVGHRHCKFWTLQGRNLKSQIGLFNKKPNFEPQTCVCFAFDGQICVTGGYEGNLFIWNDQLQAQKAIGTNPHQGQITQLICGKSSTSGNLLFSSGVDGKIISYHIPQKSNTEFKFEIHQTIDLAQIQDMKGDRGIVSLAFRADALLVGTKGSEILEVRSSERDANPQAAILQRGHSDGELWGLAVSPTKNQVATCGGDKTVRIWELEQNNFKLLQTSNPFEHELRSIDWSNNDTLIAGDVKGYIYCINPTNLMDISQKFESKYVKMRQKKSQQPWITDLKISPDNKKVAYGAHQHPTIEVWEISDKMRLNKQESLNSGISGGYVTHIDWSKDSETLMVNSSAWDLKYTHLNQKQQAITKEKEWQTVTCIYSWYTQGIFPHIDGYEVNTCSRSFKESNQVLASGDDYGRICLYNYPVTVEKQVHKQYLGHSSRVTRVRFNFDDRYLVTLGGQDKTMLIWETDINQKKEEDDVIVDDGQNEIDEEVQELTYLQPKKYKRGADKFGKQRQKQSIGEEFDEEEVEKGEEFSAIKPWHGAIKEPSSYYKDPLNQNKKPPVSLNLDFVFGYRARDSKNNVRYLANGQIVYYAASLGIIYESAVGNKPEQKFFNLHTDDITAMDLHPDQVKVATGQIGPKPLIFVWDTNTLHPICTFKGQLTKGIAALAFSPSGDKLAACAIDTYHELAVFDITTKSKNGGVMITKTKSGPDIIMDLKWKTDSEFCTVGIKHMKVWTLTNTNLKAKRGIFNKPGEVSRDRKQISRNLLVVTCNQEDYFIGAADGNVLIFKSNVMIQPPKELHQLPVECLTYTSQQLVISGSRDGKIKFIDKHYNCVVHLSDEVYKPSFGREIKALHMTPDCKNLVIGTEGGEILEVSTKDSKIGPQTRFSNLKKVVQGHYAPNKQSDNELWGLAVFKDQDHVATCGDDGTLRVWNINQKKMVKFAPITHDEHGKEQFGENRAGDLTDNCKGRSLAVSNDSEVLVVGTKDGMIKLYDKEMNFKTAHRCAKESISDIKFSPGGETLAIGSHDNAIYIYAYPDMKHKFKPLRKHTSYITHLDFSFDSNSLHSNCGAYELLYWDIKQDKGGKQIPGGATLLRDEKWHTMTTPLSWHTKGIWPEYADGTDINAVDRSHATFSKSDGPPDNYHLVATGDDFGKVKLFRYPCVKQKSQFVEGVGHSSHVTNVKWTEDDSFLLSTGGGDNCLFVWKVNKNQIK